MAKTLFFLLLLGYGLLVSPAIAQEAVPDSVIAHKSRWAVRNSFWYAYSCSKTHLQDQYYSYKSSLSEFVWLAPSVVYHKSCWSFAGGITYTGAGWDDNTGGDSRQLSFGGRIGLLTSVEYVLFPEAALKPTVFSLLHSYYKKSNAWYAPGHHHFFLTSLAGVRVTIAIGSRFLFSPAYAAGLMTWKRNPNNRIITQYMFSQQFALSAEYLIRKK